VQQSLQWASPIDSDDDSDTDADLIGKEMDMRSITRKWIARISVILFVAIVALFMTAETMIGLGVRKFSQLAQEQYPSDRVSALIKMVECESCPMADRNHAVWALGQLADQRALPILEKHYTGKPCDHVNEVCQYELDKALRLVRSGHNTEAVFWRWMLPNHG
jgi:hypothetical protein